MLPWIFTIAFLAIAPTVLFYTSGYRWSAQKGRVEKSGTVIIDSTPSRATIRIDGREISEKTPATIQNMPPGIHQFLVTKEGFHPWEKSLDARPEFVTFANTIWLWKKAQPELRFPEETSQLSLSPNTHTLLRISSATGTIVMVTDLATRQTKRLAFPHSVTPPLHTFWSDSGRFVLLEPVSGSGSRWLIDTRSTRTPLELPQGHYRWNGEQLVGNNGTHLSTIHVPRMDLTRSALGSGIVDRTGEAELRAATNTDTIVYMRTDQPQRGLVLPPGQWNLWSHPRGYALLRSGDTWLALQDQPSVPLYQRAKGDMLRTLPETSVFRLPTSIEDHFLLVHGGEIWLWNPLMEPELLFRQSDRIVNAAWHHTGNDIFFATATGIFALNIDPRNGHLVTALATFDHISDFVAAGSELFIAGTKNAVNGVWTLTIES